MNNRQRIKRIKAATRAYAMGMGDEWAHDRETLTDMLTDMLHMCASSRGDAKVDFERCLSSARAHFAEERPARKPR